MSETKLHADDIRRAGCAYLQLIANEGEDTWETVDVDTVGTVTVHPSHASTTNQHWLDLFNQLQADDLLFFVRKAALATSRRNRLIVRRKGQSMPHDCAPGGELAAAIDWPRSALLNMVLQTPYCLSVSACRRADLPHVLRYGGTKPSMTQVSKPVYASPTRVDVNLDSSRTGSTEPDVTYPQICFAVDNFDSAFDSLVLRGDDHCYSVCLWGHPPFDSKAFQSDQRDDDDDDDVVEDLDDAPDGGRATAVDASTDGATTPPPHVEDDPLGAAGLAARLAETHLDTSPHPPAGGDKTHSMNTVPALLFAGYVSFSQLQAVVDTTGTCQYVCDVFNDAVLQGTWNLATTCARTTIATPLGVHPLRLWLKGGDAQHHVLMKGPGGVGHADVAVTVCSPREEGPGTHYRADQGPEPPAVQLKRALFSQAAKLAHAVGGREGDAAVRCALMTLTLPVEHVARALFGLDRQEGG